ncbi:MULTISPECIES: DotA/TraY family protein [Cysteiniphilum]|uniref:DotA/TraY family protein n=1 Tax=Cysteiniphilum litorale TaxID=2056700 RepID=A0A8J2Z758_9GAMM|nr:MULTISPECIES: DotA/TraY family protein [Cysteiniphilum]GGG08681.1 hypothetical protein GCM10010995_27790 [Cysteiniphilum litorale]
MSGFDWNDLGHNWGFVYRLIQLLFGDFVKQYGQTSSDNAGSMYTIITHLGYWSCYAGLLLLCIILFSSFWNIWRISESNTQQAKSMTVQVWKALIVGLFIAPIGLGGTSVAQRVGVIKTALMGDSFANMAYKSTVAEMLKPPVLSAGAINPTQLSNDILQAEVCTLAIQAHDGKANLDMSQIYHNGEIKPVMANTNALILLGDYNRALGEYKSLNVTNNSYGLMQKLYFGENGICGSINFPALANGTSFKTQVVNEQSTRLREAVINLVNNIAPSAEVLASLSVDKNTGGIKIADNGDANTQEQAKRAQQMYLSAVNNYIQEVQAIPGKIQTNVLDDSAFVDFIDQSGWGLGVLWWKVLADIQSSFVSNAIAYSSTMSANIIPVCQIGWWSWFGSNKYCVTDENYKILTSNLLYMQKKNNDAIIDNVNISKYAKTSAEVSNACSASGCSFERVDGIVGSAMNYALVSMTGSQNYVSALDNYDYKTITDIKNQQSIFTVAANLGSSLFKSYMYLYGGSVLFKVSAGVAHGASQTIIGKFGAAIATEGVASILEWMSTTFYGWATALMVPTNTPLVILPFTPIIIWGMLLISYFIMLIEAFIAINLGMALWVVPDEQFISGRVIRTIMMLCSLLLRPFLFVVGLASAYALSPIALTIWNTLFFWGTGTVVGGSFYTQFFYISVYIYGLIKFAMICYNVSFIMPDKILQWMGSGYGDVSAFGSAADFTNPGMGGGSSGGGALSNPHATKAIAELSRVAKAGVDAIKHNKENSDNRITHEQAYRERYGDKN